MGHTEMRLVRTSGGRRGHDTWVTNGAVGKTRKCQGALRSMVDHIL